MKFEQESKRKRLNEKGEEFGYEDDVINLNDDELEEFLEDLDQIDSQMSN